MNVADYWSCYGELLEDNLGHPTLPGMKQQHITVALYAVRDCIEVARAKKHSHDSPGEVRPE
jgi:hypothetical protein